jgi:hypothetical protein
MQRVALHAGTRFSHQLVHSVAPFLVVGGFAMGGKASIIPVGFIEDEPGGIVVELGDIEAEATGFADAGGCIFAGKIRRRPDSRGFGR